MPMPAGATLRAQRMAGVVKSVGFPRDGMDQMLRRSERLTISNVSAGDAKRFDYHSLKLIQLKIDSGDWMCNRRKNSILQLKILRLYSQIKHFEFQTPVRALSAM